MSKERNAKSKKNHTKIYLLIGLISIGLITWYWIRIEKVENGLNHQKESTVHDQKMNLGFKTSPENTSTFRTEIQNINPTVTQKSEVPKIFFTKMNDLYNIFREFEFFSDKILHKEYWMHVYRTNTPKNANENTTNTISFSESEPTAEDKRNVHEIKSLGWDESEYEKYRVRDGSLFFISLINLTSCISSAICGFKETKKYIKKDNEVYFLKQKDGNCFYDHFYDFYLMILDYLVVLKNSHEYGYSYAKMKVDECSDILEKKYYFTYNEFEKYSIESRICEFNEVILPLNIFKKELEKDMSIVKKTIIFKQKINEILNLPKKNEKGVVSFELYDRFSNIVKKIKNELIPNKINRISDLCLREEYLRFFNDYISKFEALKIIQTKSDKEVEKIE